MELMQYLPQTDEVHAAPLLASPPWINKYYVMDLAPGRSLIEWAVQHGRTVFAISYRNPDSSLSGLTMDDYLVHGTQAALDVVTEITRSDRVDIVAVCLGGALATMNAAHLAAGGESAIGTLTLINTLLDYAEPGQLGVFVDEGTVRKLERRVAKKGYLDGADMAGTFNALRANELIFSYVASNWLMGEQPPAFDLLAWNADSTRLPAAMCSFYLRSCYPRTNSRPGPWSSPAAGSTSPPSCPTRTSSPPSATTSSRGRRPTSRPGSSAATCTSCSPAAGTSPAS